MKKQQIKQIAWAVLLMLVCVWIALGSREDIYSAQFLAPQFGVRYIADYSGQDAHLLEYIPQGTDTVKLLTKGPVNLEPGDYRMEISYAAQDSSTVLRVFASDYYASDNTAGKVFVRQQLDPAQSVIRLEFTLDQKVDSMFFTFETSDESFVCGRWDVASTTPVWTDRYLYAACLFVLGLVLLVALNRNAARTKGCVIAGQTCDGRRTRLLFLLVGFCAVFVASIPVLNSAFAEGHDTAFHIARIEGISRAMQSGQFPVRVHGGTLNDYGYPNSLFYPELLLYLPALLRMAGASLLTAFRAFLVFLNVLTFVFGYISFRRFTGSRFWGLVLAAVYLLNPYRLICLYYRSAIGEAAAMVFLPLVVYGLYAILYGEKKDWRFLVLGATGVVQSHILSTQLAAIFAAVVVVCSLPRLFDAEKRWKSLLAAAVCTALLNVWFLVPMLLMILQLGLSVFSRPQGVVIEQSLDGFFGFGSLQTAGHFPLGWVSLLAVPVYLLVRIIVKKTASNARLCRIGDLLLGIGCVCVLGTTFYTPWQQMLNIPVLGKMLGSIQFAYRLLGIAQVCLAFVLGCAGLLFLRGRPYARAVGVGIVCLTVVCASAFYESGLRLSESAGVTKSEYTSSLDNRLSVGQAEYIVEGADPDKMVAQPPQLESTNETFAVSGLVRYGTRTCFSYTMDLAADTENKIVVPVTYIPNYVVKVNGQRVPVEKYEGAKVAFQASAPQADVTVEYREPLTFRLCELVSLGMLVLLVCPVLPFIYSRKKRK